MLKLKAPFPYFGGKSRIAALVWERLGNVDNYCEPFFGSGAVLWLRRDPPKIETVNDADCYVANFWRATQQAPDAVADFADGPVNEADLHARHRWLVLSDDAAAFRQLMRSDPDYFDPKVAGWWCWGLCCWIGSGWCTHPEWEGRGSAFAGDGEYGAGQGVNKEMPDGKKPRFDGGYRQYGHGVHAKGEKRVNLSGGSPGSGALETGIHSNGPSDESAGHVLFQQVPLIGDPPRGVHRGAELTQQLPKLEGYASGCVPEDSGTHLSENNRPQLADAFSRGRGVHGNDSASVCEARREWLLDWFSRLRDRLRTVRVCCGDWSRVCSSESVLTRLGTTGVFLDPPYGTGADRDANLYSTDSLTVAADVMKWCLEYGNKPGMRIVLAGYAGEGHEELESHGWTVDQWAAAGGYGNRSQKGKDNAKKERLWCSPGCNREPDLFDNQESEFTEKELA